MNAKKLLLVVFFFYLAAIAFAQSSSDTLTISPTAAEKLFLERNLTILAERLQIDQAAARIIQAKVWPNPTISIEEINVNRNHTSEDIRPLLGNFARNQQFTVELEQLVYTARKRKKNILLEEGNKLLAQQTFTDFVQALKVEFKSKIAILRYQQRLQHDLIIQEQMINRLLTAQTAQFKQGNISRAEFLRIRSLQIAVRADLSAIYNEINEQQAVLKTLLVLPPTAYLALEDDRAFQPLESLEQPTLHQLIEGAEERNTQIQLASQTKKNSEQSLIVEKANRTPDITFHLNYDRAGSTMFNFYGVGVSMDLPFFDRNKGNIKAAQFEVQKADLLLQDKKNEVYNQLVAQYNSLQKSVHLLNQIDRDYLQDIDQVQEAVVENFIKRNLNLLEFLDTFNAFKEDKERYYTLYKDIQLKKYELDYLIGPTQ